MWRVWEGVPMGSKDGNDGPNEAFFRVGSMDVIKARSSAIGMVVVGVVTIYKLVEMKETTVAMLGRYWEYYPVLGLCFLVLLGLAALNWFKVPKGAAGGTLRVGAEGIDYRVGSDHHAIGWDRIAATGRIQLPGGKGHSAIWLSFGSPAPMSKKQERKLEAALYRRPYRVQEIDGGILIPVSLFAGPRGAAIRSVDDWHAAMRGGAGQAK